MADYGFISEYFEAIRNKTIIVGTWVTTVYELIIKELDEGSFFYDGKKAKTAVLYIENFCHHHEGALAPQLIKLELWQKALISLIFGIVDADGLRQFREVFLVIGRKNGKTLLASAIASYCAYLDGEQGGRIYMAAPKLQQANLCFNAFYQTIKHEPELAQITKKRRSDIYIESTNTSIEPLAFSEKKSDGLNISLCIADEIASWQGDAGLKFYEVLKSSMGSRKQPLLLNITTAGYTNDSIFDELMKRSTRFLQGDSKETRLLPVLYMIDDVSKWDDIEELKKSNPNLGVSTTEQYLRDEIAIAEGSLSKKAEFICKYANIKQNSSSAWLSSETVRKCCGSELKLSDFAHSYAVVGLDLSQTTDLTAAVCLIEKDGEFYVFSKFWLPAEKIEEATARDNLPYRLYMQRGLIAESGENFIDYNDCFEWLRMLVEKYEILPLMVGYDRYSAQYLIQDLKSYGFQTDDVYQGDNLWGVLQEVEGLMKDGRVHIGDNDLLKVHLLNSGIKMNNERGRGKLIKISPSDHIDGMAALADAFCVRQKWFETIGEQLQNK